jgi:hypothetical protein
MVPEVDTVDKDEVTGYTECTFVLDEVVYIGVEDKPVEPYPVVPVEPEVTGSAEVLVDNVPVLVDVGFIILLVAPR